MQMVKKSQFAALNDKIYFSDEMCFLPYGHYILNDIRNKNKKYKHIHQHVQQINQGLLDDENKSADKCERIRILRSILNQPFTFLKTDSKKRPVSVKSPIHSTRHYILTLFRMGGPKIPPASFLSVTSRNVGTNFQHFLTFSCNLSATLM